LGQDGHIASLFPGSQEVHEIARKVVTTISPQHPKFRISISPLVIEQAKLVYVLVNGNSKIELFKRLCSTKKDYSKFPAQMVKKGIWLLA
jgi:6-phosphogluconolactonase